MCGRYYIEEDVFEMREILKQLSVSVKTGEIFPTNRAPVLAYGSSGLTIGAITWGFPRFGKSGVIINARSETVTQRPLFASSFAKRRVCLPATGFFEWGHTPKRKYLFYLNQPVLYLAGIYNTFQSDPRFVILTQPANDSISDVHNRMPIVLSRQEVLPWMRDDTFAAQVLERSGPQLLRKDS